MSSNNSKFNSASHYVLATLLAGASLSPALAQDAPLVLGPVKVEDNAAAYKAESSSPKATAPLRDTPQTVTVITKELIADQNLLNLRDILSNTVPGITFTAGEGGGGYGDGINLRGYSATSDITLDGVRDSAQYTRSDPFNIEQIEVTNGANGVNNGAGAVGGGINMSSKVPQFRDAIIVSAGGGTDTYGRLTVDAEQQLDDKVSFRLNAMVHHNDVPGRDVEKFSRYGIAPSFGFQVSDRTRITASYFYQHDNNIPQYGVPYFLNAFYNGGLPGVPRSAYYGYSNMDRQKIDSQNATIVVSHQFLDNLTFRNLTRISEVEQDSVVNPPQGTWCLANGRNPSNNTVCASPGTFLPSGPRGTARASRNRTFFNQSDFNWQTEIFGFQNNLVFGAAFTSESYRLDSGNAQRTTTGATPTYPVMNIINPDNVYTGPMNRFVTSASNGARDNSAFYLFDTLTIIPELQINAGVRWERNSGRNNTETYSTTGVFTSATPYAINEEDLISYRVGAVYKPVEEASIYVAYGNSKTPSQSAVNGSCTATGTGANCNVKPEGAQNIEIGAKWDILGEQLSLAAALFRNERTNYRVASGDPLEPDQVLDGASRVDGVSLTVSGVILPGWQVFSTYTFLESEVLQSVSDYCLANPLVATCTGAIAGNQAGNPLTNTPKHAGSLWTTYAVLPELNVGYGVTVQGGYFFNNGAPPLFKGGSYVTHRAMLSYDIFENFRVQVNANNLFDKTYYTRGRNNGWATPGEGRSFTVTGTYRF